MNIFHLFTLPMIDFKLLLMKITCQKRDKKVALLAYEKMKRKVSKKFKLLIIKKFNSFEFLETN